MRVAAVTAEPPTATAPALALAFIRIAQLRAAGYDLVYPERDELARLVRGPELISIPLLQEHEVAP
jgi:hypothetical protein